MSDYSAESFLRTISPNIKVAYIIRSPENSHKIYACTVENIKILLHQMTFYLINRYCRLIGLKLLSVRAQPKIMLKNAIKSSFGQNNFFSFIPFMRACARATQKSKKIAIKFCFGKLLFYFFSF